MPMHDLDDMSDDELSETIWDRNKHAFRGKMPTSADKKGLTITDWIGWIMAVLLPVTGALLVMWRSDGIMQARMERLENDYEDIKEASRAQWERFGRHIESRDMHE